MTERRVPGDGAGDSSPTLDPVVLVGLQELAAQDQEGVATMVGHFLEDAWVGLAALGTAGRDGDHAEVVRVAHRLKGSCAMFAAAAVAAGCAAIERHPPSVLDVLPGLEQELDRVAGAFGTMFGP